MAESVLDKITKTKEGKEVFKNLSETNKTIQLMYKHQLEAAKQQEKWEKDKEKQRKKDEQDKKRQKGDPIFQQLFGKKNSEEEKKAKNGLMDLIKNAAIGGLQAIGGLLTKIVGPMIGGLGKVFTSIMGEAIKSLAPVLGNVFRMALGKLAAPILLPAAGIIATTVAAGLAGKAIEYNVKGGTKAFNDKHQEIDKMFAEGGLLPTGQLPVGRGGSKNPTKPEQIELAKAAKERREKLNALQKQRDEEIKAIPKSATSGQGRSSGKKYNQEEQAKHDEIMRKYDEMATKLQTGGHVNVPGSGSGDKVPMWLPPDSFVMNRNAAAMLQSGGLVPTLLEPGEKVFGPGQWGPMEMMMNTMIPRFQEGGQVVDPTYGKYSKEGILPSEGKTTPKEINIAKVLDKFSGKAMGGEVEPKKKGIYIEGGREGYAPHFHINRADQENFGRNILDEYVKVNGKPLSSGATVRGGEYGASRDGGRRKHTGIDFAFGGNTQLSLTGSAEWLSNKPVAGIGDKTSFKTPKGVFEVIHGTYKGNELPGNYAESSGNTGNQTPGPGLGLGIMGQLSGMGAVGQALKDLLAGFKKGLGDQNSWVIDQLVGAGQEQQTEPTTPTTPGGSAQLQPGRWNSVLELIKKHEAGANGFEAMYPSTRLPGATKMTIAEVSKRATGAVGAWQNLPRYLNARAKAVGLDPNKDLYNEANQQKIAEYLIGPGQANVTVDMAKTNPKKAMLQLSKVWAAIPKDDSGKSFYAGVGNNAAHIKPKEMYDAFARLQTGGVVNLSKPGQSSSKFKQAQQEFANQIAAASGGGSSVIVVPGGGSSAPVGAPDVSPNQLPPNLPNGPSSAQAIDYFYRFAMGAAY